MLAGSTLYTAPPPLQPSPPRTSPNLILTRSCTQELCVCISTRVSTREAVRCTRQPTTLTRRGEALHHQQWRQGRRTRGEALLSHRGPPPPPPPPPPRCRRHLVTVQIRMSCPSTLSYKSQHL
ncbi:hypothetical protein E2C01_016301 [Portunus trituberculatus]|uniref:Uncharacterized protein n=1 Tax=Portunus trituberculatus TaxID=210409 RepID=A0A5B7DNQ4_PORTR|nr:hypothetical protein [Portunus trituberculatus]